jgi:hypothetical protein
MKQHLNLLPLATRKHMLLKSRMFAWCCVWVTTLLAAAVVCFFVWTDSRALRLEAATAAEACIPLEELNREIDSMQRQLTAMMDRESLLAELCRQDPTFQLISDISRSADKGRRIFVGEFDLSSGSATNPAADASDAADQANQDNAKESARRGHLTLKGSAADDMAISRFVAALRSAAGIAKVELRTTRRKLLQGQTVREYEVQCCLNSSEDST